MSETRKEHEKTESGAVADPEAPLSEAAESAPPTRAEEGGESSAAPEGEATAGDSEPLMADNPELVAALEEATAAVEGRGEAAAADREAETGDGAPGVAQVELAAASPPDAPHAEPGEEPDPIAALQGQLEEVQQRYIRLAADFDNFRKRTLKERQEALQFGHQNLVKDLLPTVDNLQRAIAHAEVEEGDVEALLLGVQMIFREFEATLGKHGVTAVDPQGGAFDPTHQEAVAQVPDANLPPNHVVTVLQRGYRLRDRLLRPARVMVSKRPEQPEEREGPHGGDGAGPEPPATERGDPGGSESPHLDPDAGESNDE